MGNAFGVEEKTKLVGKDGPFDGFLCGLIQRSWFFLLC
jgi:hypothetical protein